MSALTDAEQHALRDALDDEDPAWATYDQAIRCASRRGGRAAGPG